MLQASSFITGAVQRALWDQIFHLQAHRRTRRLEYWTASILIAGFATAIIMGFTHLLGPDGPTPQSETHFAVAAIVLFTLVPAIFLWIILANFTLTCRRFRDAGVHPFWYPALIVTGLLIDIFTGNDPWFSEQLFTPGTIPFLIIFGICLLPSHKQTQTPSP